eukprot:SAG31_NODE_7617_length_1639_cov_1.234416_4_plen_124_part_00
MVSQSAGINARRDTDPFLILILTLDQSEGAQRCVHLASNQVDTGESVHFPVSGGLSPLASPLAYNFPKHPAQSQAAGGLPPPTGSEASPLGFANRNVTLLKLRLQAEAISLSRSQHKRELLAY